MKTTREKALSVRHRRFVDAYLSNGMNATQAYVALGYAGPNAESLGSRMVKEAKDEIERRVSGMGISADFVKAKTYQHCNSEKERISLEALRLLAQCLRMFEEPTRDPAQLPPMIIVAGELLPPPVVLQRPAVAPQVPHEPAPEVEEV